MRTILVQIGVLLAFSAEAKLDLPSTVSAEGPNAEVALERARASIPNGFVENSAWTSPILDCEDGFYFKDIEQPNDRAVCENEWGQRSLVTAILTVKRSSNP